MQMNIVHSPKKTENHSPNEVKKYFEELQNTLPDNRDVRGRKRNLAFVLTSFIISLFRCTGHLTLATLD